MSLSRIQISLVERANFFAIVYSPVKRFKGKNPVLFITKETLLCLKQFSSILLFPLLRKQ
nr:MAG TPA: hypothetical protein [Caudoviricetes sp.]